MDSFRPSPEEVILERHVSDYADYVSGPTSKVEAANLKLLQRSPKNFARFRRSRTVSTLNMSNSPRQDEQLAEQRVQAMLMNVEMKTPSPEKAKAAKSPVQKAKQSFSPETPDEKVPRGRLVYESVYHHL